MVALITERAIRRNSFTSVRQLRQQIELFVQRYNADATPRSAGSQQRIRSCRRSNTFSLSPGQAHDAPATRELLNRLGAPCRPLHLIMDRAYEGNETPVGAGPGIHSSRAALEHSIEPWEYDREMYRRRNQVERLFRRLKGFSRIFSRFEKLDVMFLAFVSFVLVADELRGLC